MFCLSSLLAALCLSRNDFSQNLLTHPVHYLEHSLPASLYSQFLIKLWHSAFLSVLSEDSKDGTVWVVMSRSLETDRAMSGVFCHHSSVSRSPHSPSSKQDTIIISNISLLCLHQFIFESELNNASCFRKYIKSQILCQGKCISFSNYSNKLNITYYNIINKIHVKLL